MNAIFKKTSVITIGVSGRFCAVLELKETWRGYGYFEGNVDPGNQVRRENVNLVAKLPERNLIEKAFRDSFMAEEMIELEIVSASPALLEVIAEEKKRLERQTAKAAEVQS